MKRLIEDNDYRPVSGHQQTKDFHRKYYNSSAPTKEGYYTFSEQFICDKWNPYEWVKVAKSIGATYMILTARHHDGYCLWNTKTTDRNCVASGPKRDILKEFRDAVVGSGLKFGIYYSWMEFDVSVTKEYLKTVVSKQIDELIEYRPSIWWFDGQWECKSEFSSLFISDIVSRIKLYITDAIVNDRVWGPKSKYADVTNDELAIADFRVYGDRYIPNTKPKVKWEHITTIGHSWGYNKEQEESDYQTAEQLYRLYNIVKEKGGKLLINLGPDRHGIIDDIELKRIRELSLIMNR
jgi:alpha-L-fucosidase